MARKGLRRMFYEDFVLGLWNEAKHQVFGTKPFKKGKGGRGCSVHYHIYVQDSQTKRIIKNHYKKKRTRPS